MEAGWRLVIVSLAVRPHQYRLSHMHGGVHNLRAPSSRNLHLGRHVLMGDQGFDFAAETLFIKLERRLALPVELKIWLQLHGLLLSEISDLRNQPAFIIRTRLY